VIRCPTEYLGLDGFDPRRSERSLLVDERLFVSDDQRLIAIGIEGTRREWEMPRSKLAPARYQVPRRMRSCGRRLWAGHGIVCQLLDGEEGVTLLAHQASTGRELWRLELPTPPPLPWTEAKPAWDGASTEELDAFLVASDVLAVAVARTTRRTTRWPDNPAPEFHAQLEVTLVEPSNGSIAWTASFPDIRVPILEKSRFAGPHVAGRQLDTIDWTTGAARHLADLSGEPSWPRLLREQLIVASRSRGTVAVDLLDATTGERLRRGEWRRNAVRETRLFVCGDHPVLQVNDQFVSLLSYEELTPRWEARAKPYVYGIAATESGPIFVGTSGNGGGLYAFDRRRGDVVTEVRLPGGAWDPTSVDGTRLIASTCGDGLAVADGHDGRVEIVEIPGASAIAGSRGGHVVVVTGAPRPGVQVIDVRRVFR
jgi:hypothetical protein